MYTNSILLLFWTFQLSECPLVPACLDKRLPAVPCLMHWEPSTPVDLAIYGEGFTKIMSYGVTCMYASPGHPGMCNNWPVQLLFMMCVIVTWVLMTSIIFSVSSENDKQDWEFAWCAVSLVPRLSCNANMYQVLEHGSLGTRLVYSVYRWWTVRAELTRCKRKEARQRNFP